jgi:hypothetical protein
MVTDQWSFSRFLLWKRNTHYWTLNIQCLQETIVDIIALSMGSWKLNNVDRSSDGWPKIYYLELLRASESTLSCWSRLHLQSLAPTNPHWGCVVGYGPFSLRVIQKEGLCPNSGDINRLMMIPYLISRFRCALLIKYENQYKPQIGSYYYFHPSFIIFQ